MLKVLYIEDNLVDAQLAKHFLSHSNVGHNPQKSALNQAKKQEVRSSGQQFQFVHATKLASGLELLSREKIDVVLLDLSLPDGFGLETFKRIHEEHPKLPIVVLSSLDDEEIAIEAVQKGAQDYIVKCQNNGPLLVRCLRYAVERQKILSRLEEALQLKHYLTYHDVLTSLPNRQMFYDHLSRALAYAKRNSRMVAVLFLDLDGFKRVNDTLGHSIGDLLLQSVAQRLKDCIREGDILARLGGDEFTVILEDISKAHDAARVAQKILQVLSKPLTIEKYKLFITSSIGISLYPSDGSEVETLVKNGDVAMYRAKKHGKNSFQLYNLSMNARDLELLEFENRLRGAIDNAELLLHYQPQVDLSTGYLTGMEALVRWQHPELGLIMPGKFIPVAEETGFIEPIGEWVLHTACAQNKLWQNQGLPPLRMSVNISICQFRKEGLIETVHKALDNTGLCPNYLGLEITESSAMQDVHHTIAILKQLKQMGIQLSVDDFGTGYSSLNYLKRFPIDILKIDRSFIKDTPSDLDDAAITTAIIALAHSLDLKVIAEGVETEEQLKFIQSLKCDEMQGFYFCKPLPAEKITEFMQEKTI